MSIDMDAFCVEERGVAAFDLVRWVREKSTTEYVNGEFQYDTKQLSSTMSLKGDNYVIVRAFEIV